MTDETDRPHRATEVRKILDRAHNQGFDHTDNVPETVEAFAKEVVENGTFTPDCNVTADVPLTLKERLTGQREQDVTAMLIFGMMLGSALERDVPMDSSLEDAWREGEFEIPDRSVSTDTERGQADE